ncbi:YybS family protein [Inconstantimicrobium mannanitabidum]|uniref:Membrane protein n=1 Tax=Inconstantimicrobium mannanitabidum TaxID=1604901 RepID=A0ACB5RH89_9CLOT|nr:YybS family protein [Clostridium sp. TW13]GKX68460.1 membrane protein [Clostridium sp. TW13]
MKKKSLAMVESGIMSVLVVVFMMMAIYVPVMGVAALFIVPIPIVILNVKYNIKYSVLSIIVSGVLLCMFNGVITGLANIGLYAFPAIALGQCIKYKKSSTVSFIALLIGNIVGNVSSALIYIYLAMNTTVYKLIDYIVKELKETLSIYSKLGLDPSSNLQYKQFLSVDANLILNIMPAILIIGGAIFALLNYNITREIFKKLKLKMNPLPNFTEWYTDTMFGGILIIIICIGIMTKQSGLRIGEYIFYSGSIIFQLIMFVIGLSVISYFLLNKIKMKKGFVILICVILSLSSLQSVIVVLGITDFIVDFRSKDANSIGSVLRRKLNINN